MAVLEYPHGVSLAKTCAVEYGGYMRRQLVVTGTTATVELQPLEYFAEQGIATDKIECNSENAAHWGDARISYPCAPFDRYDVMMRGFAEIVRGERKNPYTPDYELMLFRLILQACGASESI
jgi:predicted dehydrogenase